MTYYYKKLDENGRVTMIGTQSFNVTSGIKITEEEYNTLMDEITSHAANVQAYVKKVRDGEITIEDVPADCKEEVSNILSVPQAESPNNEFGVPNDTYNAIIDGYTLNMIETGVI